MIFETLQDSNERGELMLVDGGMCHWHLRRDGQLTIREIIVECGKQGRGIGASMLHRLIAENHNATSLFAKCPTDLPANGWYEAQGFNLEGVETTNSGRQLNRWRLPIIG
jgi:hypothetical protein